jgi:hypothetical protein
MRWAGHIACMGRNPEGKRPPGKPKHRWNGYIVIDLREMR